MKLLILITIMLNTLFLMSCTRGQMEANTDIIEPTTIMSSLSVSTNNDTDIKIMVSTNDNRSSATPLQSTTLFTGIKYYIFLSNDSSIKRARFYLNNKLINFDKKSPFDMIGTAKNGRALPADNSNFKLGENQLLIRIYNPSFTDITATFKYSETDSANDSTNICSPNTSIYEDCSSEILNSTKATRTKTCKEDGSGYTESSCRLDSCESTHEPNNNTCSEITNTDSISKQVYVSYSEDGGSTYKTLDENAHIKKSNVLIKFNNLASDVTSLSVYCCKGFDQNNNEVGDHTLAFGQIVSASQPTMNLDFSSIKQDYKRELYFDMVRTDNTHIPNNLFFYLSQELLASNQSTTDSSTGGGAGDSGDTSDTTTNHSSNTGIIFHDSFESGDMSETNSSGFKWAGPNKTSIVNSSGYVVYNGSHVNLGPYPERLWEGYSDNHSMRFRYPAGNYMSEQRYSIGSAHKEIWLYFALRVPINFKHGSGGATNNKLLAVFMDDYSSKGDGSTVILEFWNDGSGGSVLAYHYSLGNYNTAGAHKQLSPFISYPSDQGRWMEIVLHLKTNTGNNTNDGVIETYRRWKGESSYQKLHSDHSANLNLPSSGPQGFAKGYMMGWSNPAYDVDTEWLLDDFTLSTESLLP